MAHAYHREEAEKGPQVLERLSDLKESADLLGDFNDIRGMKVVNPKGDEVGRVDDLFIDPKKKEVAMAEISFGGVLGFDARHALVPMDQLEIVGEESVRVLATPEIVRNAPEFPSEECPDVMAYHDYWCQPGR